MNKFQTLYEFIEYCAAFYLIDDNNAGLYPIATFDQINDAVVVFLKNTPIDEIAFDSIDREKVRKIIQPEYQF